MICLRMFAFLGALVLTSVAAAPAAEAEARPKVTVVEAPHVPGFVPATASTHLLPFELSAVRLRRHHTARA